ncbi:MAG: DUF4342 domain-containing protein [Anaerolineaceae bacterium]|nr:MAG: DUF4342 domain-containing protein [Anaerolineaceae bacterium]
MSEQQDNKDHEQEVQDNPTRTFAQNVEVAGGQVLEKVRELVKQGNVRRIIIRTQEDRVLLDTPLNVGAGAGAVAVFLGGLPLLLVTAGVAALARVKLEIIREVGDGDILEDDPNRVRVTVEDEEARPQDEPAS